MKHMIKSEPFWTTVLVCGIMAISLIPWILKVQATPIGREFIPVHNSLSDYPYYTSIIKQGIEGATRVTGKFTTEPQHGGYIHFFYLVLGWIGRSIGATDAHRVYHAARYVFGSMWIVVIYRLIREFHTTRVGRLSALFFVLYSSSFPILSTVSGHVRVSWYMSWWTELDPIQRVAFLPHYLVGHILLVTIIMTVTKSAKLKAQSSKQTMLNQIVMCVLCFLAAFIHPPSFIMILLIVSIWILLTRNWKVGFLCIIPSLCGIVAIGFIQREMSRFPWTLARVYEGQSFALSLKEYLLALGPVIPIAVVGFFLIRRNRAVWLLLLWIVVSIGMTEFIRWFPSSPYQFIRAMAISNTRFLQVAVWVPIGILASHVSVWIYRKCGRGLWMVCLFIFGAITCIGYPASIQLQKDRIYGGELFTYPTIGWMEAMRFIPSITKPNDVILALPLAGQMIPSIANRTIYTGNQRFYTLNMPSKMETVWKFYHGSLSRCQAYHLLIDNRIAAVFYGFDEQAAGVAVSSYPFLLPWKKFDTTSIYLFTDVKPEGCQE